MKPKAPNRPRKRLPKDWNPHGLPPHIEERIIVGSPYDATPPANAHMLASWGRGDLSVGSWTPQP